MTRRYWDVHDIGLTGISVSSEPVSILLHFADGGTVSIPVTLGVVQSLIRGRPITPKIQTLLRSYLRVIPGGRGVEPPDGTQGLERAND